MRDAPRPKPDFHKIDSLPVDFVPRLRLGRLAQALVDRGARPVLELLLEARELMPQKRRDLFDERVRICSELEPEALKAAGGDKIPAPPLREAS